MTVLQVCRRDVDLVDLDESAWAAAERMRQRSVGSLVVLNDQNQPIGIVTNRDLVEKVLAPERSSRTTRVRDIMAAPVKTVPDQASVEWALTIMRDSQIRRLPVIDGEGRLVGLLTLDDILRVVAGELHEMGRLLQRQAPRAVAPPPDAPDFPAAE
jgi:CBS domain-containing protein